MNKFFIKFKDGTSRSVKCSLNSLSQSVIEAELTAEIDYTNVEYIEFNLHTAPIKAGDEGYFTVQKGDFGIAYFKERQDNEFIFKNLNMPVVGIKHLNKCTAVIVTGMPYDAQHVVSIKNNEYFMKIRFEFGGRIPYENIKLEIHDIDKEDADYCDIAREYRNYKLQHGFKAIKEKLNSELKYSIEAPNVRIRMAWKPVPCEIYEQTIENEPPVHVACNFDDVLCVMEAYKKAGIEKAEFCLVGWNMKGHDGRWPQILPVESSIGGEEGLRKVIKRAKELGYAMTCHTNSTDAYSVSEIFDEHDIALCEDGKKSVKAEYWSGGRMYNVCPKRGYEISMQTLPEVAELGFRGMHYIDVITCTPARECYSPEHPINKREGCEYFDKLFEKTKEMFGSVGSEGSYDHSLKNCDYVLYVSFADFMDESGYELVDKAIPFWQLVYHGIVQSNPYARTVNAIISDDKEDILKTIEYGGKPQIYYYARFVSDNKDWIGKNDFHCHTQEEVDYSAEKVKQIVDIYNELSCLQYEFMENHEEIKPNVFKTTYSDGSFTVVDYNTKTYSITTGEKS